MKKPHKSVVLSTLFLAALLSGPPSPAEAAEMKMDGAAAATSTGNLADLNEASKEQLMTLPGIGEEEARKIIEGRPYHSKTDLRKQQILPAGKFYKIVDKVTIKLEKTERTQPPAPAEAVKEKKPAKP